MRFLSRNLTVALVTVALPLFFSCEKHKVGELPHYHDPGHGHGGGDGRGDASGHGAHGAHGAEDHHGATPATKGEAHDETHDAQDSTKPQPTPATFFPQKKP